MRTGLKVRRGVRPEELRTAESGDDGSDEHKRNSWGWDSGGVVVGSIRAGKSLHNGALCKPRRGERNGVGQGKF